MYKLLIPVVPLLLSTMVFAQSTNKTDLIVYGVATRSCSEFLKVQELNNEIYGFYVAWLQGYLSAINIHRVHGTQDLGRSTDLASILLRLKNYCSQKPSENFMLAVSRLESDLK